MKRKSNWQKLTILAPLTIAYKKSILLFNNQVFTKPYFNKNYFSEKTQSLVYRNAKIRFREKKRDASACFWNWKNERKITPRHADFDAKNHRPIRAGFVSHDKRVKISCSSPTFPFRRTDWKMVNCLIQFLSTGINPSKNLT